MVFVLLMEANITYRKQIVKSPGDFSNFCCTLQLLVCTTCATRPCSRHRRISLEGPQSGTRLGFANLAAVCAYLECEMRDVEQGK